MSNLHTYPRHDDIAWTDLDFPPPVELDTVRLQRVWSAWFTLTPTVGGPLCRGEHALAAGPAARPDA